MRLPALVPGRRPGPGRRTTLRRRTDWELAGRTALVTGVTSGIGRATARALLAQGMQVAGCARDAARLDAVAGELPGLVVLPADLRVGAERAALVDAVLDRFGHLDVLVNNAGVGYVGRVADMTADDVERVVQTNVTAVVDLTRLALPGMLRRGDGDVVMISSSAVWATLPPLTAYAASKHAVDGFVVGLRREVATKGVRVGSVNPGFVSTEFLARAERRQPAEDEVPTSPGASPERVAAAVVRLLARRRARTVAVPRVMELARVLTVPPFSLALDLGVRLAEGRLVQVGRGLASERRSSDG
jgi:short-subunit dehydrogenase